MGKVIEINDADVVTIYISVATNFKNYSDVSNDENKLAEDYLNTAVKIPYPELLGTTCF